MRKTAAPLTMDAQFLASLDQIDARDWNALTGVDYPFLRHEFLYGLERSGCTTAANKLYESPAIAIDTSGAPHVAYSAGGTTAANESGSSEREGLVFNGGWLLARDLSLNFSYTWLDATEEDNFSSENTDEIRRPKHIASANLNWRLMDNRANLNLNVDYNGEQDDCFFPPTPPCQERVQLDDFTLVTLAGSYRLSKQLQLFGRVENALDEDYEEVSGYVSPGRTAYLGVRYNLNH